MMLTSAFVRARLEELKRLRKERCVYIPQAKLIEAFTTLFQEYTRHPKPKPKPKPKPNPQQLTPNP